MKQTSAALTISHVVEPVSMVPARWGAEVVSVAGSTAASATNVVSDADGAADSTAGSCAIDAIEIANNVNKVASTEANALRD